MMRNVFVYTLDTLTVYFLINVVLMGIVFTPPDLIHHLVVLIVLVVIRVTYLLAVKRKRNG